jgi:LPXTG-motif cell wall-anchored protein
MINTTFHYNYEGAPDDYVVAATLGTPLEDVIASAPAISREGYIFVKWHINASGEGENYPEDARVGMPGGMNDGLFSHLYAQWIAIPVEDPKDPVEDPKDGEEPVAATKDSNTSTPGSTVPKTGDDSNGPGALIAFLLFAAGAILLCIRKIWFGRKPNWAHRR